MEIDVGIKAMMLVGLLMLATSTTVIAYDSQPLNSSANASYNLTAVNATNSTNTTNIVSVGMVNTIGLGGRVVVNTTA